MTDVRLRTIRSDHKHRLTREDWLERRIWLIDAGKTDFRSLSRGWKDFSVLTLVTPDSRSIVLTSQWIHVRTSAKRDGSDPVIVWSLVCFYNNTVSLTYCNVEILSVVRHDRHQVIRHNLHRMLVDREGIRSRGRTIDQSEEVSFAFLNCFGGEGRWIVAFLGASTVEMS